MPAMPASPASFGLPTTLPGSISPITTALSPAAVHVTQPTRALSPAVVAAPLIGASCQLPVPRLLSPTTRHPAVTTTCTAAVGTPVPVVASSGYPDRPHISLSPAPCRPVACTQGIARPSLSPSASTATGLSLSHSSPSPSLSPSPGPALTPRCRVTVTAPILAASGQELKLPIASKNTKIAGPRLLQPPCAVATADQVAGQRFLTPQHQSNSLQASASARALSAPGLVQHQVVSPGSRVATSRSASPLPSHGPMPVSFHAGNGQKACRILCYGDSLTAGFYDSGRQYAPYGRHLADHLAEQIDDSSIEVIVCGQSGHTAADMVSNLDKESVQDVGKRTSKGLRTVLKERSGDIDLVMIMAGTNDLGHDFQVPGIIEDLQHLHSVCHSLGVPTMALAPPPVPRATASSSFERARQQLIQSLRKFVEVTAPVAGFVLPGDLVPATYSAFWDPDRLHFAPAGSQQLGKRLAEVVAPLLKKTEENTETPKMEIRESRAQSL